MPVPAQPKIYHIVHVDCLLSILRDGFLWCDAEVERRNPDRTIIGMNKIKQRRLMLPLSSHPRSVMLYLISQRNHPELRYCGGQEPILHLQCDMHDTIE